MKQGDIVGSNGRIVTQQDGRKRYIEFAQGLVLETDGKEITVNPIGKTARLVIQQSDLHTVKAATEQSTGTMAMSGGLSNDPEPQESPQEPEPAPEAPKPSLSTLRQPEKPTEQPKRRPPTAAARRRRRT